MDKEYNGTPSKNELLVSKKSLSILEIQKKTSGTNENLVKLKLDVECSKDFASDFLGRYFTPLQKEKPLWTVKENALGAQAQLPLFQQQQLYSPPTENSGHSDQERTGKLRNWKNVMFIFTFLFLIASLSVLIGHSYSSYNKKQVSNLARYEKDKRDSEIYETILSRNYDILLDELEELTSILQMRDAFPEITSMSAIVRTKRGPNKTEKAKAAIEFIWRVKRLFNTWTENPKDFPSKQRPIEKDIKTFLHAWKDAKRLLDQLEIAKQNPLNALNFVDAGNSIKLVSEHLDDNAVEISEGKI